MKANLATTDKKALVKDGSSSDLMSKASADAVSAGSAAGASGADSGAAVAGAGSSDDKYDEDGNLIRPDIKYAPATEKVFLCVCVLSVCVN